MDGNYHFGQWRSHTKELPCGVKEPFESDDRQHLSLSLCDWVFDPFRQISKSYASLRVPCVLFVGLISVRPRWRQLIVAALCWTRYVSVSWRWTTWTSLELIPGYRISHSLCRSSLSHVVPKILTFRRLFLAEFVRSIFHHQQDH